MDEHERDDGANLTSEGIWCSASAYIVDLVAGPSLIRVDFGRGTNDLGSGWGEFFLFLAQI
jgi:hypothetical protein